ncbi:MAG: hypothetical protein AMJ43_07740 [Coxiella sp. DG_40]|nr:MAG: hypothetical protein AMJ43_07740 [Coxiella sp. DG_40]
MPITSYPAAFPCSGSADYKCDNAPTYDGGSGVLFPPVSGYKIWLDASDESTITESSNLVSSWDDKSDQGNNATQTNETNKPTYDSVNQSINFDGSDNYLDITGILTTDYTIFCVLTNNDTSGVAGLYCDKTAFQRGLYFDVGKAAIYNGSTAVKDTDQSTGKNLYTAYYSSSATTAKMSVNGTVKASNTSYAAYTPSVSDSIGRFGSGSYWLGNMHELVVYDSSLSDGQISSIESYLNTKWGL